MSLALRFPIFQIRLCNGVNVFGPGRFLDFARTNLELKPPRFERVCVMNHNVATLPGPVSPVGVQSISCEDFAFTKRSAKQALTRILHNEFNTPLLRNKRPYFTGNDYNYSVPFA